MDETYELQLSRMRDPEAVKAPVSGVVVQLESDKLTRFAETDAHGRFVFDGLAEGDYKVSAFAAGYPAKTKLLAEPRSFHLEEQSCGLQILLVPKN